MLVSFNHKQCPHTDVISATPLWIVDINAYRKMRIYMYRSAIGINFLQILTWKHLKLWLKRPANISLSISFHYFAKNVNLTGFGESRVHTNK